MNNPRIEDLERAVRFAIQYIEQPPGLAFSQREKTPVLQRLRGVLDGVDRIEERDCAPLLVRKGQGDG